MNKVHNHNYSEYICASLIYSRKTVYSYTVLLLHDLPFFKLHIIYGPNYSSGHVEHTLARQKIIVKVPFNLYAIIPLRNFIKITNTVTISAKCEALKALFNFLLSHYQVANMQTIHSALYKPRYDLQWICVRVVYYQGRCMKSTICSYNNTLLLPVWRRVRIPPP
jgi:hypothetical protein